MIVTIAGVVVNGTADLSGFVDRTEGMDIQAAIGKRMDTLSITLFDKLGQISIPDRAEIIIYDADPATLPANWLGGAPLIDPPPPNSTPLGYIYDSAYTYDGVAQYDTMPALSNRNNPANWTPRLFGGYTAIPEYEVLAGFERKIHIQAQDYTFRNKTTIVNRAYGTDNLHPLGWSDQQIIRDLYLDYRPDIDVTFVSSIIGAMPAISFPTHTLEQFFERIIKITAGYFRIDYYKRIYYGALGYQTAPYNISDVPNPGAVATAIQAYYKFDEGAGTYAEDSTGSANRATWHGTLGSQWATGKINSGGNFNGTNNYLDCGTAITQPTVQSWSAWVKPSGSGARTIVGVDAGGGLQLRVGPSQYIELIKQGNFLIVGSAGTVPNGVWSHVAVTFNAGTGAYAFYINGIIDTSGRSPTALTLGAHSLLGSGAGFDYYCGVMDEVGIWNRTLSATEVVQLYNSGAGYQVFSAPPAYGVEQIRYAKDSTDLINRIWVVGGVFRGNSQTFTLPTALWDGTQFTTSIPRQLQNSASVTVTVNGVDQGAVGLLGTGGTLDAPANFQFDALVGIIPPVIAFKTPPPPSAVVQVTGIFTYQLIQIVEDLAKQQAVGGLVFEKVVRDRRIDNIPLAIQVGQTHLALQSSAKAPGTYVTKYRGVGSSLLQPGQQQQITSASLFAGGVLPGGGTTLSAVITALDMRLTDDLAQPYETTVSFADRPPDIADEDFMGIILGEQARINAALEQTDINQLVSDIKIISSERAGFQAETLGTTTHTNNAYTYDSAAQWDYASYA